MPDRGKRKLKSFPGPGPMFQNTDFDPQFTLPASLPEEEEPPLRQLLLEYMHTDFRVHSLRGAIERAASAPVPPKTRFPERRFQDLEAKLGLKSPDLNFRHKLVHELTDVLSISTEESLRRPRERVKTRREFLREVRDVSGRLHELFLENRLDYQLPMKEIALPKEDHYRLYLRLKRALCDLSHAADEELNRTRFRWGRPINIVRRRLVKALLRLYEYATDRLPRRRVNWDSGTPYGDVIDFVAYVYRWIGPPFPSNESTIDSDLKRYWFEEETRW